MSGHQSSAETAGGALGGSASSMRGESNNHRSGLRRFAGRVRRRLAPSRPPREGFGKLDHPSPTSEPIQAPIDVFGWWLFPGGAARSGHISINGERVESLAVHRPRTDVAATLPRLPDAGISGFAGTWRPTLALAGHTIRLEFVLESPEGVMHTVAWREVVLAPGHRGSIESYPGRNGLHGISGWAFFDDGPVTRAWATWNGALIAELEIGLPRSDVGQGYSSLPWASTSGFSGHLDLVGTGDLSVLLVREDRRIVYMDSIHLQMPNAGAGAGAFECPQDNDLVDGAIVVKGWWAFTGGPPRGGFLYCDDQPVMPIDVHLERADIATRPRMLLYYPHIRTCGFACRWRPNREMARGDHLLSIRLESPGGHETWLGPRRIRLGDPHRGEVHRWPSSASPVVEGWAIFEQGPVYRAFLCVNNERTIEIDTGLPTPDLLNDFSDKPWAAEAGFRGELTCDVDWSRAGLSVLLVGQMGQQHILETRRPSEEAAGHCRIAGFGASFDPIMPPDGANAHLVVTGWAHKAGRRLDRLWLSTRDLPSWQCQVGIDRPDVTRRDALGFRAFIPADVLLRGGQWPNEGFKLTLHTESGFGPIDLVTTAISAGPCGTVGDDAFDMEWRHAAGVLDVRIVSRTAESGMTTPRLLVDSIDVTERLCHESGSSPGWRYSLATKAYESASIELRLPDGEPEVRSVIQLSKSETRYRESHSPSPAISCALITAVDGTEYVWIEHHSTCPTCPVAYVVDDKGRPRERGQLRRMTTPAGTRDYFVYVGFLPADDGSCVNIINHGEDGRQIGATRRIWRTSARLGASSPLDLSPPTTNPRAPAGVLPDHSDELATCWLLLGPKARQQTTFDAVLEAAQRTRACNLKPIVLADPPEQQDIRAVTRSVVDDDQILEIMSLEEVSTLRSTGVGDVILPFNRAGLHCIDPRGLDHLITALQCEDDADVVYGDEFVRTCRDSRATPMQYGPFSTTAHLLGQVNYGGAIAFRFDAFDVSGWCAEGCDDSVVWGQVAKAAAETHRVRHVSTAVLGYEEVSPHPSIAETRIRDLLPESHRGIVLQRHAAGGFMPRTIEVEAEKVTIVVHNSHSLPVDVCSDACERYHDFAAAHGFEIHLVGPCLPDVRQGADGISFHACEEDRIEAEIAGILDVTAKEFAFLIDAAASPPGDDWLAQWIALFQLSQVGIVGLTALTRQGDRATQIWGLGGRQPVAVLNSATEPIVDCLLPDTSLLGLRRAMWTQVGGLDMSLPHSLRWMDLALSAQMAGWRAIVTSQPVFEWSLRSCSAQQPRATGSPSATEIRKWRDLLRQYFACDDSHPPGAQVADVEPADGCSIVPSAHPLRGRRVLFWIGSEQRATRIECVAQLAAHLNAKGWECRAVVPVGPDMHRAFTNRGILFTVSPNGDFAPDHPDADHRPFHGWQPDLIHVFGSGLCPAARAYPTPSAPIVLAADDDSLLHSLTSDDPSVATRLQVANRRVTAFLTSACTQYADLCRVFGENRVFLIENGPLASEKPARAESLDLGGSGGPSVVFLEPHDLTQTTAFLSAVEHFESRGGIAPVFQILPTSDPDNGASANAFGLACKRLGVQARMNLMSAGLDCVDVMREAACVTFLGPAEPTAPEVATAISLGVWVITTPPCERIEADATSGQLLERLHGSELANAWLRRPRGRANSPTELGFPSVDTSASAIDRLYRRCLA